MFLLAPLLSSPTTAQFISDEIWPTSASELSARLQIPFEIWTNAFSSANATGFSRIKGKNTTLPYDPDAPTSDEWTYTIQVRDDVPTPDGLGYISGTWLKLEAPQNLLEPSPVNASMLTVSMHPSWEVCRLVWAGMNLKSDGPISGPGCSGFLPDACIADLKKRLEGNFTVTPTPFSSLSISYVNSLTLCAYPAGLLSCAQVVHPSLQLR